MTDEQETNEVRRLSQAIIHIAERTHPNDFKVLFAAVMANTVGALPDDYWEQMVPCPPCATPGCNCHIMAGHAMKALTILRDDHIKTITQRSVKN